VTQVEVEYLEATPELPTQAEVVNREKPSEDKLRDQIVEQQKQLNDEVPMDSRCLSAFNREVIQQTRASKVGKFNNTAQGAQPDEGRKYGD